MKLFKKNENAQKAPKQKKLKSALLLKHGSYNAALIAIVLVAVVVLNVLITALADRFPLQIDLSTTGENTVSEENIEYLKAVDKEVNIVVCATEEGYVDGYLASVAAQYYMAQDTTGKYYAQTINLLRLYEKYNKNLKLTFADPDAASFANIQSLVPSTTLNYGDVLVYSTFKNEAGADITNTKVVTFSDMYELYDESGYAAMGYGAYTVSGSNVETAITSAVYSVMNEDRPVVAVLSGHSAKGAFDGLEADLELNNFEITTVSDQIITAIPQEADVLAIAAPTSDFAASELEIIEKFLENGGKKGKSLLFFGSAASANLPNLYSYLKEWGVTVEAGSILVETDETNYLSGDRTTMGMTNQKTDFSKAVNSANKLYIAGANLPMTAAYTTFDTRTTTVLLSTQDSVVAAPTDVVTKDWTPGSEYSKDMFDTAILTADTTYNEDNSTSSSYVLAFSSVDFISSNWSAYEAVGNNAFAVAVVKNLVGQDAESISFLSKTVAEYNFTQPTQANVNIMRVIFQIILPIGLIAVGIFVWIRRKNR